MEYRKKRTWKATLPSSILGGICGGAFTGLLLVLFSSFIAYRTQNPTALLMPIGLGCLSISALVCGFVSSKLWGHASLAPALVSGAIFGVFIVALGLCIPGSTLPLGIRIAGVPAVLILSLIGGGMTMKKKGHRRAR